MAMCIHGQEVETCSFGCTFRNINELKLENDKLREMIKKMNRQQNCRDRDCEFLKHGVCVADKCVWPLTKEEEDYEAMIADLTP